jgi:hypothetical protein
MAYSSEIAKILADQLARIASENRHQIAGHFANIDFWVDEARHCLALIDGYRSRFERLKSAQMKYVSDRHTTPWPAPDDRPESVAAPRPVPNTELKEVRRELCNASYRFLLRFYKEKLLDQATLRRRCDELSIGVDIADLR